MAVYLRKRKNSDESTSLYLDIYHNGKRKYEFLPNLKLVKATNPTDRQNNKSNLELAKAIQIKRSQELAANDYSILTDTGKKTEVIEWMESYVNSYKKKDYRILLGALNRFKAFLKEEKKTDLTFGHLTELIIADFQDYLKHHGRGEGVSSYFNRFKKIVKQAWRQKLIPINPAAEVKTSASSTRKKDILKIEEIQTLANTPIESLHVKNAFLFSCLTGLRWIDVSGLKWKNVDLKNRQIKLSQSKTDNDALVPLNDTAIELIGEPGKKDDHVFDLPTANGANKTLKAWVKRAGIEKQITWHNARHSFGTNLIYHGADVTTASSLLGHSSLKHTHRYVKAAQDLKERATDKLNIKL